ncbi:alpha-E domain-containing protein [Sulfurisphaera ohwakuensis]|uniref:alpha-E domain-containing protein n=1 Tax=Sulfurisphaera ohwakuensis TaxID=69656 RepID=UPI0036F1CB5E
MIPRSTAYKIYWAGRYLERIENMCRVSLLALHNGVSLDNLAKEYGLKDGSEIFQYIKNSFAMLREDLRSFVDEKTLIEVNSLGFQIDSDVNDLEGYFIRILNDANKLSQSLETFFVKSKEELRIRAQEENEPELFGNKL